MDTVENINVQSIAHRISLAMTKDESGFRDWNTIVDLLNEWARHNVPEQYNYSSRATYWGSALRDGIITKEVYDYAAAKYANLWNYTGD